MKPSGDGTAREKSTVIKNLIKIVMTGCFFILIAFTIKESDSIRLFSGDIVRFFSHPGNSLLQFTWVKMLLFVLAAGLLVTIGVPRLWVSALAGAIFGCLTGFILGVAASVLGALGVYQISRLFLPDSIKHRLTRRFDHRLPGIKENGFWWVMYARLFPFSNSTLLSAICGIFGIPLQAYIVGSAVGFMPLAFVFSFYGDASFKGNYKMVAITCLCLLVAVIVHMLIIKLKGKGGHHVRES